jgi:RNA polymerase sigma-70 factor (ECF subfamily)
MPESSLHTTQLQLWARRLREGDRAAPDELLRATGARLERLTRKMLRRFPGVARWEGSDDVLQSAVLRLLRALREVEPASVRAFFGLAAEQIRRELLDLARHYYGPRGHGGHHDSQGPEGPAEEPASAEDGELERWRAFHEAVEGLPAEQREVVGLIYYHGWTREQVPELFGVNERTVRRRWDAALVKLHAELNEGGRTEA